MKKRLFGVFAPLFLILLLAGCTPVGRKATSISIIYGTAAVISFLLLVGCLLLVRKNRSWFILLFSSVLVVNIGYTLLSVSSGLEMALHANRISYIGSVFLPFSMLMIILRITNTHYKKRLPAALFMLSFCVFLIAASPGILDIYYKEISFQIVDGTSTLVKVYGPLHPLYLVYLVGYFSAMIAVIIRASVRKTIAATSHAIVVAIAVFVNIGVWFIEQVANIRFEMLSVSYIISELFLLGVHMVARENQRLRELVQQKEAALQTSSAKAVPPHKSDISADARECFTRGVQTLTPTERAIFEAYLAGNTTKEIMANMNITENTLKFHNKNLYGKLGVSSRKQLLAIHQDINN